MYGSISYAGTCESSFENVHLQNFKTKVHISKFAICSTPTPPYIFIRTSKVIELQWAIFWCNMNIRLLTLVG